MAYKLLVEGPPLECDLVMKGGITSGVVYPRAVVALAGRYRLRRIGGSSAGAIAAALTVAAEYRRSGGVPPGQPLPDTPDAHAGWAELDRLPDFLKDNLAGLFEPSAAARPVFDFLLAWLEPGWTVGRKLRAALVRLVRGAPIVFVATLLVCLTPAFTTATALVGGLAGDRLWTVLRSLLVWLPMALVLALVAAGVRLAVTAVKVINGNGFGLVNGHRPGWSGDGREPPALTDWLTRQINLTAGLPTGSDAKPLTFGDLWGTEACAWFFDNLTSRRPDDSDGVRRKRRFRPRPAIVWSGGRTRKGEVPPFDPILDLRVMTTCLSHRLPRVFPFLDETYFFCPTCLRRYFPENVVSHVEAHARDSSADASKEPLRCPVHPETTIRRLPFAPDLPVVLAARLSLSFPVLISAVPFYCYDHNVVTDTKEVVPVWFSDGGITSNFPMQFFDAWVPDRPTFGINLDEFNERYHRPGEWVHLRSPLQSAHTPVTSITDLAGFLAAVGSTMHSWPDQLQMDAPGFRDRIVTVRTEKGEGGLNLKMGSAEVDSLVAKGAMAGDRIVTDFDFGAHSWLRFRIAMNGISVALARLRRTFPAFERYVPAPWTGTKAFSGGREQEVREEAQELMDLADRWASRGWPATRDDPSRPEPELRFGSATR